MTAWVWSDLHAFHTNILEYCARPFADTEAMNEHFVRVWNERVSDEDIGVFVGDVSAGLKDRRGEFASLLRRFNGRKILIRGNHDHEPDNFYLENGFQAVREHLHLAGVVFHHFPPSDDRKDNNSVPYGVRCALRYLDMYKPWAFLHGHDHRVDVPERAGCFNCASDRLGHAPLPLFDALYRVDSQKASEYIRHIESGLADLVKGH